MKIYEPVHSAVKPLDIEITLDKVYLASNISIIQLADGDLPTSCYEFKITEYTKDEYLNLLAEKNTALQQELLDTQSALCDVYELLEGGT